MGNGAGLRSRALTLLAAPVLFTWFVVIPPSVTRAAQDPRAGRPNVIFILADDLGINDLGVYGRRDHRTPRIDALAAQGSRFTASYAASPICSPSRAALLTGLAPARLHLTTFLPGRRNAKTQLLLNAPMRQYLPSGVTTLAEHLARAGYATAAIGKWHLGEEAGPGDQGFRAVHRSRGNTAPSADEGSKGEFALTAAAEQFVEENRDRPFFLYLAHDNPHIPYAELPSRVDAAGGTFEPVYAAVVSTLDRAVGRLLDRVHALGLDERTIVIFTSDNGGLHVPEGKHARVTHNTPYRAGKGFLYEGGIRVPLVVRWPGRVPQGGVVDAPFVNTNWLPTLVELLGLPRPDDVDGESGAARLLGRGGTGPLRIYWHMPHYTNQGGRPSGAVREGDWKLVEDFESGRVELFDLARDPGERDDRSAAEPRRAAALLDALRTWRRDVGAQGNARNQDADAAAHRELYGTFDASRFDPLHATPADWARAAEWRRRMDRAIAPGAARWPQPPSHPAAVAGTGRRVP